MHRTPNSKQTYSYINNYPNSNSNNNTNYYQTKIPSSTYNPSPTSTYSYPPTPFSPPPSSLKKSTSSTQTQTPIPTSTSSQNSENKSIWDTILDFFKPKETPEEGEEQKKTPLPPPQKNFNQRCNCKHSYSKDYCDSIHELLEMTRCNMNFDDHKRNIKLYQDLLQVHEKSLDVNGDNIRQIKKDLARTYPSLPTFKDNRVQIKLKNVLRAFSNYEPKIKYFQGMNFIVGFFLYHCEEHVAFWIFVSMMEEYDLRGLFMEGFPGMKLHVAKVEEILKKNFPKYHEVFQKINVKYEIFMLEWMYSLFSSLIPLELQIDFYRGFFSQGWTFFYKMCISAITSLNGTFNSAEEIYIALKFGKNEDNVTEEETKNYWQKIISKAYIINIGDV